MNEAVKRFLDEMGQLYAAEGDRDVSPILFKADDENDGKVFELSLPKGEPHPFWRVRERKITPNEIRSLVQKKTEQPRTLGREFWGVGSAIFDSQFRVRGYVYNARQRNRWNISIERIQ
jgi:hypothetical protein